MSGLHDGNRLLWNKPPQSSMPFSIKSHFKEDTISSIFSEVEFRKEHPVTGGDEKRISEPRYALQNRHENNRSVGFRRTISVIRACSDL